MIFVTVGTHSAPFDRLLEKIDQLISEGRIRDKVVAQTGYTRYVPRHYEHFSFCTRGRFEELMREATTVVTHGGIGSILPAVRLKKTVIAVPRLSKWGEHNNDHQRDICLHLSQIGLIHTTEVLDSLPRLLGQPLTPAAGLLEQGALANAIAERLRLQQARKAAQHGYLQEPVDLIAILAGDKPLRHKSAARLLTEQLASFVTVTGEREEIDSTTATPDRILECGKTRNTYEDSLAIKTMAEEMGFRSIAVVTSKQHRRRAELTFKKAFAGSPILIYVVCANELERNGFLTGLGSLRELLKILYYGARGRL